MLWWLMALGFAFGILPRGRPGAGARLPLIAWAALVAWTAISLVWTSSAERTSAELARTVSLAGIVVLAWGGLNRHTWRSAAAGLSVAALAIPAVAVASRLAPDAFPLGVLARIDRLSYPLGYWNAVAAWSAMALAIALALSAHLKERAPRAASLAASPFALTAIYLTYSRTGTVAAALAIVAVLALGANRLTTLVHALAAILATAAVVLAVRGESAIAHGTGGGGAGVVTGVLVLACLACAATAELTRRAELDRRRMPARRTRILAVAGACLALAGGIAFGPSVVAQASSQFTSNSYPANTADPATRLTSLQGSRYAVWSSALDAFASKPATGIGPGTFDYWWDRHGTAPERLRDAHSLYLETLAELGLPGFALLAAIIAGLLAMGLRARRAARRSSSIALTTALLAAFFVYLFCAGVDWMWESTGVTVVALGAIAVASASSWVAWHRSRRLSRARLGIVLLAVLAGAIQVPGLVSTGRVRASAAALARGQRSSALGLADDAVAAEPWAASPYAERATVELTRGDLSAARDDARQAIEREPANWQHRLLLARVDVAAGRRPAALRAAEEAVRLRPSIDLSPRAIVATIAGDQRAAGSRGHRP